MEKELERALVEFQNLQKKIKFNRSKLDYSRLEYFKNLLNQLDVVDTSLLSIYDLYRKDHVYFSSKYASLLGWDLADAHDEGVKYVNERCHPADLLAVSQSGIQFFKFALTLSPEEKKHYKFISEYRMRGVENEWVRVIEQQSVLELDPDGNIWFILSVIDRAPANDIHLPAVAKLQHIKTGNIIEIESEVSDKALSPREKDILSLVAKGFPSKQVADRLFLSIHTVNTHRQRIIEKIGVTNMVEAVSWAHSRGLLD